jgi:TRAP-type mannitol/chloroaromatic compound transport system substrate-binding protein
MRRNSTSPIAEGHFMSTRRIFLAGATATATSLLAAPALAQNLIEWRMVTAWPRDLPGAGIGAQRLADRIGVLTQGQLTVKLHPAGELMPGQENMAAVMSGDVEMSHDMSAYYLAKSPAFAFFTSIPLGLIAQEQDAWIYAGGGKGLWDELAGRFGVKAFCAGNTGARLGGWFRKEINTVDDLKGLRFRVGGLAGQALSKLGVTQVLMPGAQILDKFKAGELDAAQFMGPVNDIAFGFQSAVKFCYWPGFQEPCAALQLQVNRTKFEALPLTHQVAIETACTEENARALAEYNARSPAVIAQAITEQGVELKQFPPDIFKAFGSASGEVLSEIIANGDDLTKRIAASYLSFRQQTLLWTRIGDQGYANMRLLDYAYPKGA